MIFEVVCIHIDASGNRHINRYQNPRSRSYSSTMPDDKSCVWNLYGQRIRGWRGSHACLYKQLLECNPWPLEYELKSGTNC